MNAAEFYQNFAAGFAQTELPAGYKKLAGRTFKLKYAFSGSVLSFNFSTNFKAAGLLDVMFWPGEFRLLVQWQQGKGAEKNLAAISLFQYTNDAEVAAYCRLQKRALGKFFAQRGEAPGLPLSAYLENPAMVPVPNVEEWCYYVDAEDARDWGAWYAGVLTSWPERFLAAPETLEDWCWRVLWPHLERKK